MKLLLAILIAPPLFAQIQPPVTTVQSDPGGACQTSEFMQKNARTGQYWVCGTTGVWTRTSPANAVTTTTADPTGNACAAGSTSLRTPGGALYTCQNGVWGQVGGSATPTGAAGGSLTGTYPNPGVATLNQNTSGNAATATALAATPTKCAAGSYTLGISAAGNAQNCTTLATVAATGAYADLTGSPAIPALQTNGTPNGSQSLLNLASGSNITLADNGSGRVTVTGSGGSGGGGFFGGSLVPIVTGNWSNFGSGCTRTAVTGASGGAALAVQSGTGAQSICGYSTTIAAGDFTRTFVIYPFLSVLASNTVEVGFTDGTKTEACGFNGNGATSPITIVAVKSTTLTTGLAAANGLSTVGSGTYSVYFTPLFVQLSRAGANLSCALSPDGVNYVNIFTDTVPQLTASSLFFGGDPRGSAQSAYGFLGSYN